MSEQTIKEAVLVDVTETAKEAGIMVPTFITETVNALVDNQVGRLWDIVVLAMFRMRIADKAMRTEFVVTFDRSYVLSIVIGLDDDNKTIVQIGFPEDILF
jgi:hypothetical protein